MAHRALLGTAAALFFAVPSFAQQPIKITADLSEAARKLYHAEIDIPVKAGPLTLTMPEWIPGDHAPNGEIRDLTGLVFTAGGKTIPWRRDDVHLYDFHVTVPAGVSDLHVHLDSVVLARATDQMAVLEWERLMMYPANKPVRDIPIQPTVIVPTGWGIGTALTPTTPYNPNAHAVTTLTFEPTDVEQLEDSPIFAGKYLREFPLAPEVTPKHFLDVMSDEPDDSNLRPELLAEISNLVREAGTAYGSHHYHAYHFLLTLSDAAGGEGLEHGQSSDNGIGEEGFKDVKHQLAESDLLAHEFTHSWNGKYRRPATLYQPDFATPQQGELLWVYEGMTQYMGNVLATRSGLKTQAQYRDMLASSAASLDYKSGRLWRTTDDTAIASSISRHPGAPWSNWKRGQDYYQEGELLWLDADTLIRQMTKGQKSLTDFQRIFLGKGGDTGPLIVPYDRAELIRDLNQVVKYDWATFLHDRIDLLNPHADLAGIERGGYQLEYQDHPNEAAETMASARETPRGPDVWYSLGLRLSKEGELQDVRWGGPGDVAKLAPGEKLLAVNGHVFSKDALYAAITAAKGSSEPLHLIVQSESQVRNVDLNYHDGLRFPVLVRTAGTTDYLDQITAPLVPVAAEAGK